MTGANGLGFVGNTSRFDSFHNQNQNGTMRYPSPFFDIGHTYLPTSVKQMFRWCRYYFLVNPLINAVCYKMAEYPITKIQVQEADSVLRDKWSKLIDTGLKLRSTLIEIGLDYHCYGNAFVTIHWPIKKSLICSNCKCKQLAANAVYKFRNFRYYLACPSCHVTAEAGVEDLNIKDLKGIKLVRWNPENITLEHNEITSKTDYFFDIPISLKNAIMMGKRHVIESIPNEFILALRESKTLKIRDGEIFHFKRATLSEKDQGWGLPLILPVLKDSYYLQVLRKAQECVSLSTLIETSTGLVPADDVKVGDIVRTHLGRWRRVENKWYRDAKEDEVGRKLTISGLRPFPSTYSPHHPIITLRRNSVNLRSDTLDKQRSSVILKNPHLWEEVICPAEKFEVGDYVLYPKNLPSEEQIIDVAAYTGLIATDKYVYSGVGEDTAEALEQLESGNHVLHDNAGRVAKRILKKNNTPNRIEAKKILTKDMAFILGWYVGDGSCSSNHVTIYVGLDDDRQSLVDAVYREFGTAVTGEINNNMHPVHICNVLARHLIKGMVSGVATTKKIPLEILHATNHNKLSFLRGLWEADGYIRDQQAILSTASKDLAYDVYRMLLHLGCIATVSCHSVPPSVLTDGRIIRETIGYNVTVSSASKDRLLSLWECGNGPEVTSGKSGFFWKDFFATRVCAVEELEELQYIDFKIEEDSTFCTAGTATKNCIAQQYIVPLRILFPQAGSGTSDPYSTLDLSLWRRRIEAEIEKWKLDQNYIPILPIPIGNETVGGEGKALMLHQEMRAWSEQIVAGMHVPIEFIFGGLQYSGSNVSMRMLENQFDGYRTDLLIFCRDFVLKRIANYMEWAAPDIEFSRFRMADDLQRSALIMQANQAMKVSDTTFLNELELDLVQEEKYKASELSKQLENNRKTQIANAQLQGELQIVSARYQAQAMRIMGTVAPGAMPTLPNNPGSFGSSTGGATMDGDPASAGNSMPGGGQPAAGATQQPLQGEQAAPGMPEGATAYPENANSPPAEGLPPEVQSPLNMTQAGGQMNALYLARRAATEVGKMEGMQRQLALMNLQVSNPKLSGLVLSIMQGEKGSQTDNLDPMQSPLPQQKPPRRKVSLG